MLLPQSSATSQKDEENDFRFRNSRLDYTAQILYIFARLPKYVQTCIFVDYTHGFMGLVLLSSLLMTEISNTDSCWSPI